MTVKEALDTVSALKPHPYDPKHLLRELSRLDGRILREVWQGREGAAEAVPDYTQETAETTALLAEGPYDLMYIHYLMARVALWNGETERYNQFAALFEETYAAYRADTSRNAAWKDGRKIQM